MNVRQSFCRFCRRHRFCSLKPSVYSDDDIPIEYDEMINRGDQSYITASAADTQH